MVEKPTQDLDVPSKAIREEEQEDSENQGDCDNHDDHENEEEQPTIVLFTLEQLEVLLKMNRPDFIKLVVALKGRFQKVWDSSLLSLGILMRSEIERLWMLGLQRWMITFMLPRLGDTHPWNLLNLI